MQVKHNNPTPEFQPIELTIIIESAEELCGLYSKLVDGNNSFDKSVSGTSTNILFEVLFDIADERGYIK